MRRTQMKDTYAFISVLLCMVDIVLYGVFAVFFFKLFFLSLFDKIKNSEHQVFIYIP